MRKISSAPKNIIMVHIKPIIKDIRSDSFILFFIKLELLVAWCFDISGKRELEIALMIKEGNRSVPITYTL